MSAEHLGPESPGKESLTGWKEIAAYFGKGVRTVQRWERELGLPVRRLTAAHAEIIYALPEELEAWRRARGTAGAAWIDTGTEPVGETDPTDTATVGSGRADVAPESGNAWERGHANESGSPSGRAPRRRARSVALAATLVLGACVFVALAWRHERRSEQPAGWKVENHALRIYSGDGDLLWEHHFAFPLTDERYPGAVRQGQARIVAARYQELPVVIEDIDGNGSREVLFSPFDEPDAPALFCFNSDGTTRFVHRPDYRVTFGDITYDGPWAPLAMQLTGNGRSAIWVSMHHPAEFPTVIDKLDSTGRLLGQYWNNGELTILRPAVLNGRRVVLAGGSNNDFLGATLAALDEENPTGAAPFSNPHYGCRDCPSGAPSLFLILPPTDVQRRLGTTSAVTQIRVGETGLVTVVVISDITAVAGAGGPAQGEVYYRLNPQLQVVGAEIQSSFKLTHDELYRRGMLDHRCDLRDERDLWPVLRWKGAAFERVTGPEAR